MQTITLSKETIEALSKKEYYNEDILISDINCYIEALKEGRLQYLVTKVSASGMSRNILIQSCEKSKSNNKFYFKQYSNMLECLNYKLDRDYNVIVKGSGMNMLFATNYRLIHIFKEMGFIDELECETLAQGIN